MTAAALDMFADLPVVPAISWHKHVARGGPVWPQFDDQTRLRQCRNGVPCDRKPRRVDAPMIPLLGDHVWGGFLDFHFGHFIAEHLSRLVNALRARPNDPYLFTAATLDGRGAVPRWIWDILAWFGLPAVRAQIVTAPLMVQRLHAAPQGEMLPQIAPDAGYLAHLDARAAQITPHPSQVLYVARSNMLAMGGGATAGEGYLVDQLQGAGAAVLHPETATIAAQLAAYAGAKHIIFAEGSAVHGRQILGRISQRITILRRRSGRKMAAAMLAPRCDALEYLDVTRGNDLVPRRANGTLAPDRAVSFYDTDALRTSLVAAGLNLRWNPADFAAAEADDTQHWLAAHPAPDDLLGPYETQLSAVGLAHLIRPFAEQRTL